ncbi:MAG: hypothetical protein GY750_21020 [Lentisphaerae bacterium]|nr:hypothetical protein [Lentisphaerota bacterium]
MPSRYIEDQLSMFVGVKPWELILSMGQMADYSVVDKFGENPDVDTGSDPEDIWEAGGMYNYDADGTAPIVSLISDNSADTAFDVIVEGLDVDGNNVSQTITLNGTNRVALTTPLWRVFRMTNDNSTNLSGTVYCYIGTGGVPAIGNTRAIINNGNNQTLMALYTIPKGKVGFLYRGELGVSRSQATGTARCAYYSRRYGKAFTIKKRVDLTNQGSSIYQDSRSFPDVIPALTDIKLTVEEVTANNTGIFGTFDIMLADENQLSEAFLNAIGQPT